MGGTRRSYSFHCFPANGITALMNEKEKKSSDVSSSKASVSLSSTLRTELSQSGQTRQRWRWTWLTAFPHPYRAAACCQSNLTAVYQRQHDVVLQTGARDELSPWRQPILCQPLLGVSDLVFDWWTAQSPAPTGSHHTTTAGFLWTPGANTVTS